MKEKKRGTARSSVEIPMENRRVLSLLKKWIGLALGADGG
jgi:hypothetical protein